MHPSVQTHAGRCDKTRLCFSPTGHHLHPPSQLYTLTETGHPANSDTVWVGGARRGGREGEEGADLLALLTVTMTTRQAYLTCSMSAIMPEAMGAAAEVPEKDCVQPL